MPQPAPPHPLTPQLENVTFKASGHSTQQTLEAVLLHACNNWTQSSINIWHFKNSKQVNSVHFYCIIESENFGAWVECGHSFNFLVILQTCRLTRLRMEGYLQEPQFVFKYFQIF
jgi:hypothetical protein